MNKKQIYDYWFACTVLFICGLLYGVYMVHTKDAPTNIAHLLQLIIFCGSAYVIDWFGTWRKKAINENEIFTWYAVAGIYIYYIAQPFLGYIFGRHVIARLITIAIQNVEHLC